MIYRSTEEAQGSSSGATQPYDVHSARHRALQSAIHGEHLEEKANMILHDPNLFRMEMDTVDEPSSLGAEVGKISKIKKIKKVNMSTLVTPTYVNIKMILTNFEFFELFKLIAAIKKENFENDDIDEIFHNDKRISVEDIVNVGQHGSVSWLNNGSITINAKKHGGTISEAQGANERISNILYELMDTTTKHSQMTEHMGRDQFGATIMMRKENGNDSVTIINQNGEQIVNPPAKNFLYESYVSNKIKDMERWKHEFTIQTELPIKQLRRGFLKDDLLKDDLKK